MKKRKMLVLLLVALLPFLFTACSYPGKNDCQGVGNENPGNNTNDWCGVGLIPPYDPDQQHNDWYVDWTLSGIRTLSLGTSYAAVSISSEVFSLVYNGTISLDFAACNPAYSAGSIGAVEPGDITCIAHSTWQTVSLISIVSLIPLILVTELFLSTIVGAILPETRNHVVVVIGRLMITAIVIYYSDLLYTSFTGLAELLFSTILGDLRPTDLGKQVLASMKDLSDLQDTGGIILLSLESLLVAILFIALSIALFVRSVIIAVLFTLAPLALAAGASQAFRPWLVQWFRAVSQTFVSVLPLAVCLLLSSKAQSLVPTTSQITAATSPFAFATYLVYIACFLIIGTWLLVTMTAGTGRLVARSIGALAGGFGLGWSISKSAARVGAKSLSRQDSPNPVGATRSIPGTVPSLPVAPAVPVTASLQGSLQSLSQSIRGLQAGLQSVTTPAVTPSPPVPTGVSTPPPPPSESSSVNTAPGNPAAGAGNTSTPIQNTPVATGNGLVSQPDTGTGAAVITRELPVTGPVSSAGPITGRVAPPPPPGANSGIENPVYKPVQPPRHREEE